MSVNPVDQIGPYIIRPRKDLIATVVQMALLEVVITAWQQYGEALRVQAAQATREHRRRQIKAGEMKIEQQKIEETKRAEPKVPTTDVLKARLLVASAA